MGDGCLMEGISHEAASLAGTLEARQARRVLRRQRHLDRRPRAGLVHRRHAEALRGVRLARRSPTSTVTTSTRSTRRSRPRRRSTDRPSLLCCKTIIGKGAPTKAGTEAAHGAALGEKEVAATRAALGWSHPPFEIPRAIYATWSARECGALLESAWDAKFAAYRAAYPERAAEFARRIAGDLPADFAREGARRSSAAQAAKGETVATRKASQQAIEAYAKVLPEMIGGSADLTGSVFTNWSGSKVVARRRARQLRELRRARVRDERDRQRPRAARRLHSLRRHVPHVLRLRAQRAAHGRAHEAAHDLRVHARLDRPRRGRPDAPIDRARVEPAPHSRHGRLAAVRHGRDGGRLGGGARAPARPVVPAVHAAELPVRRARPQASSTPSRAAATCSPTSIAASRARARWCSRPAPKWRSRSARATRSRRKASRCASSRCRAPACSTARTPRTARRCCRAGVPRVAVEAGVTAFWHRYVGAVDDPHGAVVGIDTFGESAPAPVLFKHFGFTVERVVAAVKGALAK